MYLFGKQLLSDLFTDRISNQDIWKLHMNLDACSSQTLNESGSGRKETQVQAELKLKSSSFADKL
jgi:hypothetical protein